MNHQVLGRESASVNDEDNRTEHKRISRRRWLRARKEAKRKTGVMAASRKKECLPKSSSFEMGKGRTKGKAKARVSAGPQPRLFKQEAKQLIWRTRL